MKLRQERLKILSNRKIADGHFTIEFESPRIAASAAPGQFVQILVDDLNEPLLPRPFSFLDTGRRGFKILYQVVGKGTALIASKKKGESLVVLGPLGKGFCLKPFAEKDGTVVLVGGGVGIPPLYHLARTLLASKAISKKNIRVFLGGRRKELLHCEKEFRSLGVAATLATDDGSRGHRGVITEPLDDYLGVNYLGVWHVPDTKTASKTVKTVSGTCQTPVFVYACGPTPMLKAVTALALKYEVPCEVSVEEPMPCGFGACLGCAIKVEAPGGHRYAISCTEGPVFDAAKIIWD